MAAKGSIAKENVTNQILAAFPGAFKYDKEIRIPVMENGESLQLKVSLTCAKTNVEMGGDAVIPGEVASPVAATPTPAAPKAPVAPTDAEKKNVADLLSMLGLS